MCSVRTGVDDGVLGDNTVFSRVGFDDLEFHRSHTTTDEESVALAEGAVGYHSKLGACRSFRKGDAYLPRNRA